MKISILVMVIKVIKKIDREKITKSLKKLRNKIINPCKFKEDYNKFMDNFKNSEDYKYGKEEGDVSKNQKKNEKICKRFRVYY